ncbi:MAG: toprim domain-containing protein [Planctomycetota bacterium]
MDRSQELEKFKTEIDLRQFAASYGFELNRKKSSKRSAVMSHSNGDKLVITRTDSQRYVYFNVFGNDSGTIIDFLQARGGGSIGEIRKTLRQWTGSERALPVAKLPELKPAEFDAEGVAKAWEAACEPPGFNRYLQFERKIPAKIYCHDAFKESIRVGRRGNILFAHRNGGELTGFEVKNRGFTGFSPGGAKSLFRSASVGPEAVLIITETAIDALSVAALAGVNGKRFVSLAGQPSRLQINALRDFIQSIPQLKQIYLAFDHDEGGRKLSKMLKGALQIGKNIQFVDRFPPGEGQDWNDVLKENRNIAPIFTLT